MSAPLGSPDSPHDGAGGGTPDEDTGSAASGEYKPGGLDRATALGVVVVLLAVAGIAHTRSRPHRRLPGLWFLAAGTVCLLGSQLILYPVAFLFFAAAALFALRPVPEGSSR